MYYVSIDLEMIPKENSRGKKKAKKKPIQQNKELIVYKSPPQSIFIKKQDRLSGDIQSSKQGLYLK